MSSINPKSDRRSQRLRGCGAAATKTRPLSEAVYGQTTLTMFSQHGLISRFAAVAIFMSWKSLPAFPGEQAQQLLWRDLNGFAFSIGHFYRASCGHSRRGQRPPFPLDLAGR